MEDFLVQLLGNSPTLVAVLLIYNKLDRRILALEIIIEEIIKGGLSNVRKQRKILQK